MVLTVPFVLFGLVRYLHLANAGQGEEPEKALLGDPALGLCVVAWALTAIAVVAARRPGRGPGTRHYDRVMPRAAIVGNLVLDVVAGAPERPGGAVWYCARALARIAPEADVVLVCRSAAADRDAIVPGLERFGFPVTWQPAERTTRFSFHYEGNKRVMCVDALGDPWTPADIEGWVGAEIDDAPWVIVGALTRSDFPLETFAALTARGHRLVVDAQGLVRHGRVGPLISDGSLDRRILRHITALKLNDEEAVELCGGIDEESLRSLGIPEIVLTLGSEGALIISGEVTTRVAAVPVEGPVDPTGAGDSFLLSYAVARQGGKAPNEAGLIASRFVSTIIAR